MLKLQMAIPKVRFAVRGFRFALTDNRTPITECGTWHVFISCCLALFLVYSLQFTVYSFTQNQRAEELFLKGDYDSLISESKNIISRNPSSDLSRAYYLQAVSYLKLELYSQAKTAFKELMLKYPDSAMIIDAKIGLGDTYFMEADFAQAASVYEGLAKLPKKPDQAPQIYFKLAKACQKLGRFEESKSYFKKVRDEYPLSFESRYAADSLKNDDFFFTVQAGAFVTRANAQKLCDKLSASGFEPYISSHETKEKIYYRVRVGKFQNRQDAVNLADRLNDIEIYGRVFP